VTVCNCCGTALPGNNQLAFLCSPCVQRVPWPVILRYRRAAAAVHSFRRSVRPALVPTPPALVDELARSWSAAADIARASQPEEEKQ
jgi:hypothetical protein